MTTEIKDILYETHYYADFSIENNKDKIILRLTKAVLVYDKYDNNLVLNNAGNMDINELEILYKDVKIIEDRFNKIFKNKKERLIMNLWEETVETLKMNGKSWEDVLRIGTREGYISKELYKKLSKETDYDNGYGSSKIAEDLMIEGKGFRLVRGEYDGSEWWDYVTLENFIGNKKLENIKVLSVENSNKILGNDYVGWENLKELNTNRVIEEEIIDES